MKFLIVDDEKDIGMILEIELQNLGHQTVSFTSVPDAIEYLKIETPDVILCDYQMPRIGGLDFLKQLQETGRNIPFYLLTGEPSMDIQTLVEKGVKDILFKPQDLLRLSAIFK